MKLMNEGTLPESSRPELTDDEAEAIRRAGDRVSEAMDILYELEQDESTSELIGPNLVSDALDGVMELMDAIDGLV